MFELSLPKLVLIALVVLVLFGRGKVADLMGEFGKGVKSFKQGMADETTSQPVTPPPSQIANTAVVPPAPVAPVGTPVNDQVNQG
ncbi:MAG: twin-arginine translocase TatA/TatE family subunit [Pseudomonadota bacterium]|nr:twin-arginine translocase TatA/TatE family subunit [Pseudomonadota bacterium]